MSWPNFNNYFLRLLANLELAVNGTFHEGEVGRQFAAFAPTEWITAPNEDGHIGGPLRHSTRVAAACFAA
jgi:hypothetical protein